MFCSSCGTEIKDSSVFCYKCGEKLNNEDNNEEMVIKKSKNEMVKENFLEKTPEHSLENKYQAAQILVYSGWSRFHNNQFGIMFIEKDHLFIQYNNGGNTTIRFEDIISVEYKNHSLVIPKKFGFQIVTSEGVIKFVSGGVGKYKDLWKWDANGWVNSIKNAMDHWKNN